MSGGRRWARRLVWATLGIVLVLRWMNPPDPNLTWKRLLQGEPQPWGDGRSRRRSPTRVQPPVHPIPADLWRLEIQLAPADVETLRNYQWGRPSRRRGGPMERPEVLATIREGDRTYTNVAIHLKGSMGSFRPFDDKPAMTLNFSKHARGQNFHGFTKLSLNNSVQDSTYISEVICRELFTAAGVPAPAATHATAVVNGRDLGLFVVLEGWGKPFLRKHFSEVGGNLYEGAFADEISPDLEVNSGDHPEAHAELDRLLAAIRPANHAQLWSRLSAVLDVDRFASLLAMEVLTCHWDGYSLNRNNYRIFHDRASDRLVFLPHGMDQMFGSRGRMPPTSTLLPQMQGAVSQAFMSTREGRRLYLDRLAAFSTNLLVADILVGRVRELGRKLRPTLEAYGSDVAQQHAAEVEEFCQRIAERCESVSEQLKSLPGETRFDTEGVAPVSGWRPRAGRQDHRFERAVEDGRTLLKIRGGASGSGSWRAAVILPPGEYVFEGRARYHSDGAQGGIHLRISGTQTEWLRPPSGEWTPVHFVFEVNEPMSTVELICELGGNGGAAEFDEKSLRLIRK